jgi:hypothetical protein
MALVLLLQTLAWSAEFPTREGSAAVLRDRYITGNSTGRRAHVGIIGTAGAVGRTHPADSYLRRLTECKVIVSCGPVGWEGDSRLGESLYAGALVLSEPLLDPPPGFVDGESVVVYQNYSHMLWIIEHYLARPAKAAAIARRGKAKVAYSYEEMIERILVAVGLLNATATRRAEGGPASKLPILVPAPANVGRRGETWGPTNHAAAHSKHARLASQGELPVAVLVDTVMVEPGTKRFFKGHGGVKTVLDSLWPTVQRARAKASIFGLDGRAAPLLIGLDFDDHATSFRGFDPQRRFDFWFKRSRVLRGRNHRPKLSPIFHKSFVLAYPVKPVAMRKISAALRAARHGAWADRPYDVCSFFTPRRGKTNVDVRSAG